MKILLAGATGAIGKPLVRALLAANHTVVGLARTPRSADAVRALGATPLLADMMDRDALLRAVDGLTADAVIHEATALTRPAKKLRPKLDDDPTVALRVAGTAHLLAAAREIGAGRFVTQSMALGYGYRDHGAKVLTEDDPFGQPAGNAADPVVHSVASTESQIFSAPGIEGVALRYGIFFGPGTWFDPTGVMMRKRLFPVPPGPGGTMAWIHVDDAAAATVAALERGSAGAAYNIVDDTPATWRELVTAAANAAGHRKPRTVPAWLLRLIHPYLGRLIIDTTIRVSNAKAKHDLAWTPTFPSLHDALARRP